MPFIASGLRPILSMLKRDASATFDKRRFEPPGNDILQA